MSVHLPEPLDAYFAAGNGRDIERITECFVPDARVHDEGEWREGHTEGSFPGSPVELRYRFGLRDGRIASLRIA